MKARSFIFPVLLILLFAACCLALLAGSSGMKIGQAVSAIFGSHSTFMDMTIIRQIRLPRMLLALSSGMALAVCGCTFQGLLRNPLADSYTLGISGGAAFGATLMIVLGLQSIHIFFTPIGAFAGALLSASFVYLASSKRGFSVSSLILSGVILSFVFSSLILLLMAFAEPEKMRTAVFWLMGDLSNADPFTAGPVALFLLAGSIVLSFFGQALNVMALGEEKSSHLGLDPSQLKRVLFIIASLVTGMTVAFTGMIGFVGLVIPHFMRRFVGPDHRFLLPASGLAGAVFLLFCDTIARTVASPVELPVGVVTGLAGGLFFLTWLLRSRDGTI